MQTREQTAARALSETVLAMLLIWNVKLTLRAYLLFVNVADPRAARTQNLVHDVQRKK
jgi:hypothetical protein